jgi:hypothetical protein
MSNLNLKGTTLFYQPYISHATICKLFVNKLGGMTYTYIKSTSDAITDKLHKL